MHKWWSVGIAGRAVAMLAIAGTTLWGSEQRDGRPTDRERFIGAWRLLSLEEQGADGASHKADATGQFVFSRDGHTSVQVMYQDGTAASTKPAQYALGGYEATFGRYEIDERAKTLTISVDGALVRGLVGKTLPRLYEFGQSVGRQTVQSGRTLASDVGALLT